MRFVNLAIDAAALLNASRAVASKHIALRSRQLDVESKTSAIVAAWRHNKPKATHGHAKGNGSGNGSGTGTGSRETDSAVLTAATAQEQKKHATVVGPEPDSRAAMASQTGETRLEADAGGFDTDETMPSSLTPSPSRQATATTREAPAEAMEVPLGINVNVFHTTRGSEMLESSAEKTRANFRTRPPPGGPAKEHPLRYWPQRRPVEADDATLGSNAEMVEQAISATPAPPSPQDQATADSIQGDKKKADFAEEREGQEAPSTPVYKLRESKVPASRFSRLWNYGGLAAGMLGGAVTESVSRAFGGGGQGSLLLSGKNMERLVARLSRMRGAALKLGQMMSLQDSKMLPAAMQEVLQRVQDRADYMPAWQRNRVLASNLGENWADLFSEFQEKPMASASIGQVHKAVLKSNGKPVAVKIQFPGVADSINSDLANLAILLNATNMLPKGLYLNKTIDNARVELAWECDYEREAQCAMRYKELLRDDDDDDDDVFLAPDVYLEASGKQVLTMDFLDGVSVRSVASFTPQQRDWIGTQVMRLCLREMAEFRFMQTDPNWSNFLYDARQHKLELLDFGASREFPDAFVRRYVRLLDAASRGDRERVRALSQDLGYLTGHESRAMLNAHVDSILTIAEPFRVDAPAVYDFQDQTITDRVRGLIPLMLRERLAPPPEETYSLHRKLSGAFLLCARLGSKVPCRELFVKAMERSGYMDEKEKA